LTHQCLADGCCAAAVAAAAAADTPSWGAAARRTLLLLLLSTILAHLVCCCQLCAVVVQAEVTLMLLLLLFTLFAHLVCCCQLCAVVAQAEVGCCQHALGLDSCAGKQAGRTCRASVGYVGGCCDVKDVTVLEGACKQVQQMNTPTHVTGDTAHAESTAVLTHNCPHHCKALLLMKLDAS
jgi:hypothetical protein